MKDKISGTESSWVYVLLSVWLKSHVWTEQYSLWSLHAVSACGRTNIALLKAFCILLVWHNALAWMFCIFFSPLNSNWFYFPLFRCVYLCTVYERMTQLYANQFGFWGKLLLLFFLRTMHFFCLNIYLVNFKLKIKMNFKNVRHFRCIAGFVHQVAHTHLMFHNWPLSLRIKSMQDQLSSFLHKLLFNQADFF